MSIKSRNRRPSYDETASSDTDFFGGEEQSELEVATDYLRDIKVTVEKDTNSWIPGLGYRISSSLGLLNYGTSYRLTLAGARAKAARELQRLQFERDGGAVVEVFVDDPANPEPTPAELTRIRHQQEAQNWEEMFASVQKSVTPAP